MKSYKTQSSVNVTFSRFDNSVGVGVYSRIKAIICEFSLIWLTFKYQCECDYFGIREPNWRYKTFKCIESTSYDDWTTNLIKIKTLGYGPP